MDVFFIEFLTYNGIWSRVSNSVTKELFCKNIYDKKIVKIKIRYYADEATDFYDKEVPKGGSNYSCLAVILLDSVLKKGKAKGKNILQKG